MAYAVIGFVLMCIQVRTYIKFDILGVGISDLDHRISYRSIWTVSTQEFDTIGYSVNDSRRLRHRNDPYSKYSHIAIMKTQFCSFKCKLLIYLMGNDKFRSRYMFK